MMEAIRSAGAVTLLGGLVVLAFAPWLGVWAVLSSTPAWLYPLWIGMLVSISGATMLFLAWAYDRGERITGRDDDGDLDEFTMARIRSMYEEEARKLIDEMQGAFDEAFDEGLRREGYEDRRPDDES